MLPNCINISGQLSSESGKELLQDRPTLHDPVSCNYARNKSGERERERGDHINKSTKYLRSYECCY
jgi:hypothetical protein